MTLSRYIIGFALSIALTLAAVGFLEFSWITDTYLLAVIFVALALAQLIVQLVLFLHMGQGKKPSWNITVLVFALLIVGILVGGTLWIMSNLESQHPMPEEKFLNGVVAPQNQSD
ncbi:MAG: cytochrome C oxidase subunit IV family protein [bacterium]|nr:cytochrome C oxidase subunit IV family protein [bacterium]